MDAKVKEDVSLTGLVKYNGPTSNVGKWQSGTISIFFNRDIGEWVCEIMSNARRVPSSITMTPNKISNIVCARQYFRVDMATGSNVAFKGSGLEPLGILANKIKDRCAPRVEKKALPPRSPLTTPRQQLQQQQQPASEPASPPSPQFTSVKSLPGKENQVTERTPDENTKKRSSMFLERGREKSGETLSSSNFYGNKTSTPLVPSSRSYGSFANTSGIKRRPGLLPNPVSRPKFNPIPYSWRSTPTYTADRVPLQGFSNLGNTCYMNAILQSLFGLDPFSTDLYLLHRMARNHLGEQAQALFPALGCLLMVKKRYSSTDRQSLLLANVKKAISASYKRFSGHEQHDAHEFLGIVLDQLKEEVIKLNKENPSDHLMNLDEGESSILENRFYNPTMLNFEFEVQHTITCLQCGEELNKVESFHDLSLDMPKRRDADVYRSIQDALDLFFQPESLEYVCEQCSCKRSEVKHKFTRLPRVIVLHLKRYRHNSVAAAKLGRSIKIPKFLTLKDHCTELTQPSYPPVSIYNFDKLSSKDPALGNFKLPKFTDKGSTSKRKLDFKPQSSDRSSTSKQRVHDPYELDTDTDDDEAPRKREKVAAPSPIRKILTEEEISKLSESEQLEYVLEVSRREEEEKQQGHPSSVRTPHRDPVKKPRATSTATRDGASYELPDLVTDGDDFFTKALASDKQEEGNSLWKKSPSRSVTDTQHSEQITASCDSNFFHMYSEESVERSQPHRNDHNCGNPIIISQLDGQYDDSMDCDLVGDLEKCKNTENTNFGTIHELQNRTACRYCGLVHFVVNSSNCSSVIEQSSSHDDDFHSSSDSCSSCLGLQVDGQTDYIRNENCNQNDSKNDNADLIIINSEHETSPGPRRRLSGGKTPRLRKRSTPSAHSQPRINRFFSPDKLPPECIDGGTDDIELKSDSEGDDNRLVPPHRTNLLPLFNTDSDGLNNNQKDHDRTNNNNNSDEDVIELPKTPEQPSSVQDSQSMSASPSDEGKEAKDGDTYSDDFVTLKSALASRENGRDAANCDYGKEGPEDNKENRTPPHTSPSKDEPDWITERRREREEREVKEAMEASLRDQGPTLSDPEMSEEEQIRRATELSLRDFNEASHQMMEEEIQLECDLERTEKEEEILKKNAQTGHLPYSYQLMSVVSHLGSSTTAGHYVSDVYDQRKRQWMSYDDNHVSKTTELEVCCSRQKTGYIFFYMNKDLVEEVDGYYKQMFPKSEALERPASR